MNLSLLSLIILLPFLGALLVALLPRNYRFVIRMVSVAFTALTLIAAVFLFVQFNPKLDGFQFIQKIPWVPSLGISYHVGVDGINLGLILMGALVAFAAACISRDIKTREKEFYFLLLVMTGGILGAFASLDLFFFYFFHELALVPTFIMIGVWGHGERKNYATFQITLYLSLGALIALVGLILLYLKGGARTFDMVELAKNIQARPLSIADQELIFPWLLFGFGILVSLWPFHSWAPLGYASAPPATAMLHAGVLKKFGLYGLLRVALPLMPQAAQYWMQWLAVLALGNILYNGWVAMRQRDLNLLIGNSSVAHMGFCFLGIASLTLIGVTGCVMVMVAHGLLAALTFALSGHIRQETGTLEINTLGGLLQRMPFAGALLVMAMMAGCGLPGFGNFAGEILVLFGAWSGLSYIVVFAAWGALIIGAVYMLRAVRNVLHGPLPEAWNKVRDAGYTEPDMPSAMAMPLGLWRKLPYGLLLAALLALGVYPPLLTKAIEPAARQIVNRSNNEWTAKPVKKMEKTSLKTSGKKARSQLEK
ncbi:MAG: NADH-quinone oxidoreductase subunit M [Verrucomicrobiota bacterium]